MGPGAKVPAAWGPTGARRVAGSGRDRSLSDSAPVKILSADIVATAASAAQFPKDGLPEVAFLGRSNVGKSSLLNRLVSRKQLARTSGTPGKTRLLHFYHVRRSGPDLLLVDLPGYGYAKVPRKERQKWQRLIEGYLEGREPLRAAVLLQDIRRDPGEDETLFVEWLHARQIPVLLAITKVDKVKRSQQAKRIKELTGSLPVQRDWVIATSASSGEGIEDLWKAIDRLL